MAKKKKKVPARVQMRRLAKKADKALSLYVRELTRQKYGKCPLCKTNPIQCCFHFIRRRRKILRWDIRNVIGACHSDNYAEYRNPDPSRAFYIREFGADSYLALVDLSAQSFEPTAEFLQGIIDKYTDALKDITKEIPNA